MRRIALTLVAVLGFPATSLAQNWTAAEKEVLQTIEACMQAYADQNVAANLACTHDGFVGWRYDLPGTRGKLFATREDEVYRNAGVTLGIPTTTRR